MARNYLCISFHRGQQYQAVAPTMCKASELVVAQVHQHDPGAVVAYTCKRISAAERDQLAASATGDDTALVYQGEPVTIREIAALNYDSALDQAEGEYQGDYEAAADAYATNAMHTVLEAGGTDDQAEDARQRVLRAVANRVSAKRSRKQSADSFDRCDTDGFLSQWASDITAQQLEHQALIDLDGGLAEFIGLYEGDRRVRAAQVKVYNRFEYRDEVKWVVDDDDAVAAERKWIPTGSRSRIQKQLGLCERKELAPARADIGGSGKGLAGCASAHVITKRTGCRYGSDAILVQD